MSCAKITNVISIFEHQGKGLVATLEALLEEAKSGELKGLYFAAHYGGSEHHLDVIGSYKNDPYEAYIPMARILDIVVLDIEKRMKRHG